jgi:hypothetical protein
VVTVFTALPGLALLWVLRRDVDALDAPALEAARTQD